ncbi:MAG: DUF1508 domain-containing protein [Blastocatellia bacterium]|nr:DUF1508 domain-containing protein [Blastocatellia bacterium]
MWRWYLKSANGEKIAKCGEGYQETRMQTARNARLTPAETVLAEQIGSESRRTSRAR